MITGIRIEIADMRRLVFIKKKLAITPVKISMIFDIDCIVLSRTTEAKPVFSGTMLFMYIAFIGSPAREAIEFIDDVASPAIRQI
jgi:hypothetical protein